MPVLFNSLLSWKSLVDIALVAILFYQIISMLKGTRAAQILAGLLVIFVAYVFSSTLQFETLHWIISKFYSSFIIVIIVLFQDDIRRLLTRFGRGPFVSGMDTHSGLHIIDEVINAAKSLSHERIGALIVFERSIGLNKLHDHSTKLDAHVSEQLLISIFQSFSPLHDGAVLIQKMRVSCASAQLPLSKNPRFSKKLGTRHSAAVGISEETDAVVLVVSEETGNISVACEGALQKQGSPDSAKKTLQALLMPKGERHYYSTLLGSNFFGTIFHFLSKLKKKEPENHSEMKGTVEEKIPLFPMNGDITQWQADASQFIISSNNIYSEENDALKSISDLAPKDRLDPPIPKGRPPRNVSIGGVSLDQPLEQHKEKPESKPKPGSGES